MSGRRRVRLFVAAVFAAILVLPATPANANCSPLFALLGLCPTGGPGSCLTLLASLGLCKDAPAPSGTPATPPPPNLQDAGYANADGSLQLAAGGNPAGLTAAVHRAATEPILPRTDGHIPVGNDVSQAVDQHLATDAQMAFMAKDSHWPIVRRGIQWAFVEPVKGYFQFHAAGYDDAYTALIKQGIRPVWQLTSSPRWAATATDLCPASNGKWCPRTPPNPAYFSDWQDFIKRLIQRYPLTGGLIIWNEPNYGQYNWDTSPAHKPDPVGYTNLLHASWDAVKASHNPDVPVIGGALGEIATDNATEMNTKGYLDAMLAAGAGNYMDALSFHPYPAGTDLSTVYKEFRDIQQSLTDGGQAGKRLFVDEWGVRLGQFGVPTEAARSAQAIAFLDQLEGHDPRIPGADRVDGLTYFVSLSGESSPADDLNDSINFSWIGGMTATSTGTTFLPRPIYCAMRARLAGQPQPPSCPSFSVTTGGTPVSARRLSRNGSVRRVDLRRWTQRIGGSGLPRQVRTFGPHLRAPAAAGRGGGVGGLLSGI